MLGLFGLENFAQLACHSGFLHLRRARQCQRVRLHGAWEVHPTHGQQFAFESLEVLFPKSAEGLVKYLASDAFEGVGETLAQRVVEKLGERTLERIAGDPALRERVAADASRARAGLLAHLEATAGDLRGRPVAVVDLGQAQAVLEITVVDRADLPAHHTEFAPVLLPRKGGHTTDHCVSLKPENF